MNKYNQYIKVGNL